MRQLSVLNARFSTPYAIREFGRCDANVGITLIASCPTRMCLRHLIWISNGLPKPEDLRINLPFISLRDSNKAFLCSYYRARILGKTVHTHTHR